MISAHPTDETLFDYALDQLAADERDAVEAHVRDCAACRQIVVDFRAIEAVSRDAATWEVIDGGPVPAPDPDRVRELAERVGRKDREDRDAAEALREMKDLSVNRWWPWLRYRAEHHTAGMVAVLLTEARSRVRTHPRQSFHIVTIAADIARTLSDRLDRATMTGLAANERGTVLRFLGMNPEALAAVEAAAAALRALDSVPDETARVAWNRAAVLFALERYQEARAALDEPKAWFRSIGDEVELARIGILEGSILHDEGDHCGALAIFTDAARFLETEPEQPDLAMVYANIAFCHLALRDFDAARSYGARALQTYERVDMLNERIRTQWMFAQLLVESGNVDEGLRHLRTAAAGYETAGMIADAAQVDLERVEILLRIDEWAEAAAIARHVATVFERTGQRVSYVHALAYLREAVDATTATPELARYVRGYLGSATEQPFQPPPTPLPS
jgi:tetratricopeptide (TPR) repeat protein